MSYVSRQSILPSSRQSAFGIAGSASTNNALQQRIALKRAELDNLKQLRDLSGNLATQMGELEKKLATLRDGTESGACVLQNWEGVLSVISMASSKAITTLAPQEGAQEPSGTELPVTLVRIPVESKDEEGQQEG
jgi:DASH complex subunit DAD2